MKKLLAVLVFITLSYTVYAANSVNNVFDRLVNAAHLDFVPDLIIVNSNVFNAKAANGDIYLNTGVMKRADIYGVAFVIAHELGHYIHHHSTSTPNNEYEADKAAFRLVQMIGFNGCRAAHVLIYTTSVDTKTHPSAYHRYRALGCGNF